MRKKFLRRRVAAVGASVALAATTAGVGAFLITPAGADVVGDGTTHTNAFVCTFPGIPGVAPSVTLPFPVVIDDVTAEDAANPGTAITEAFPSGVDVNIEGDVTISVVGAFLAGYAANPAVPAVPATLDFSGGFSVVATNTPDSANSVTFDQNGIAFPGRSVASLVTTAGSPAVVDPAGGFSAGDIGKSIATGSGTALIQTAVIGQVLNANTAVVIDPATLNPAPALATESGKGGVSGPLNVTLTNRDLGTFTTDGASGDDMDFSAEPNTSFVVEGTLIPFTFGTCADGGAAAYPGADTGRFSSIPLANDAPLITTTSVNAVAGLTQDLSIVGSDPEGAALTNWTSDNLAAAPALDPDGRCALSTLAASGSVATSTTGKFSFTAAPAGPSGGYSCVADFTVDDADHAALGDGRTTSAVVINVLAGDSLTQNLSLLVNGGVLDVALCGAAEDLPIPPGDYANDVAARTGGAAGCDGNVVFPAIDLNGTTQTSSTAIDRVVVSDARGVPAAWTLNAEMDGDLVNGDAGLAADANGIITKSNLTITPFACVKHDGLNPNPTLGISGTGQVTLCSVTGVAGNNTGQFYADADLDLTVPGSTYAGTYTQTMSIIVQ